MRCIVDKIGIPYIFYIIIFMLIFIWRPNTLIKKQVRIHAALKQYMKVWQGFLFNAFVLWRFFLTRKSILYQLPTKLKRWWCLIFSMPYWWGQRKFMVENTVKHSSSCLMYPEAEGVQAAHEQPCIKLQAFQGWSAFSGLWLKFYTLPAQTFPSLLGWFNLRTQRERTLPLDPSKIFMVFLMCPKVIIGTKDSQKEKMIWFTYSVHPGPKAFHCLLSLELLLSWYKKVSHVKGRSWCCLTRIWGNWDASFVVWHKDCSPAVESKTNSFPF